MLCNLVGLHGRVVLTETASFPAVCSALSSMEGLHRGGRTRELCAVPWLHKRRAVCGCYLQPCSFAGGLGGVTPLEQQAVPLADSIEAATAQR